MATAFAVLSAWAAVVPSAVIWTISVARLVAVTSWRSVASGAAGLMFGIAPVRTLSLMATTTWVWMYCSPGSSTSALAL